MALPFLPEEILEHIFSYLLPDSNASLLQRRDIKWLKKNWMIPPSGLLSVCLSSKTFRRIAQPLLYRDITIVDGYSRVLLIRTLIECPILRQYVRIMRGYDGYWLPEAPGDVAETARRALFTAQISLGLPAKLRRIFARALKCADREKQQLLLIALCPKLEVIDLRMAFETNLAHKVLSQVTKVRKGIDQPTCSLEEMPSERLLSTGHLSRLRKLRLFLQPAHQTVFTILPGLPGLRTLVFHEPHGAPWRRTGGQLELRHLNLIKPHMFRHELLDLLHNCPKLQLLQIKLSSSTLSRATQTHLSDLGHALRDYENPPLESLIIHYDGCNTRSRGRIGSLLSLSNLKRLSLYFEDLIGDLWSSVYAVLTAPGRSPLRLDEELPKSLERLELQCFWANENFLGHFHHNFFSFLSNGILPNLRQILLQDYPDEPSIYTSGPTVVSYTRDDGSPNWTLTYYGLDKLKQVFWVLKNCPMVNQGLLSVEYGPRSEPRVDNLW
ncbi:hypothetical protein F4821DRAFT_260990 [Hypoxylon rubiginosum]|uniref:Uncharacterized protein n=1 Tax=Hypoxylon rubiginosum TaxID=110542 RepID=A0ACC0CYK1_9PEZI|nr:hypothetical protein F4821DRAFT_260990 [Hypoxylon rubiginosum]